MTTTVPAVQLSEIFSITVDYDKSCYQMVAVGQYDGRENLSVYSYSIKGKGIVSYEACYVYFDHVISRENAIREIEQIGWLPAKVEHLLSFGATYTEEQRRFTIVALGTVGDGGVATLYAYAESFLFFTAHPSQRRRRAIGYLNVSSDLIPYPDHRFLVVRPVVG
jgi:hypothetical protein